MSFSFPKIDTAIYTVEVPSTKQQIKIRQFKVKENKLLIMALQSDNIDDISDTSKQIINNCILEENFDVDSLTTFDVEYLLLQLRIKSVGDTTILKFSGRDKQFTDCPECQKHKEITVDLKEAEIVFNENHKDKFLIDESRGIGIKMKYPKLGLLRDVNRARGTNDVDVLFSVIWNCIEYIYDGEAVYPTEDGTIKSGIEWLESLEAEQFDKIDEFFETMPTLKMVVNIDCPLCKHHSEYKVEGLESFFV
jgi:hypothetical protein